MPADIKRLRLMPLTLLRLCKSSGGLGEGRHGLRQDSNSPTQQDKKHPPGWTNENVDANQYQHHDDEHEEVDVESLIALTRL
jgi:hypothetical protein